MSSGGRGGVYGYAVDSELPLARLRPQAGSRGRIVVERARVDPLAGEAEFLDVIENPDGAGFAFAVARRERGLLAWCAETGSYVLDPDALRISADVAGGPAAWEDRLLNAVIPVMLVERGELFVHASAVLTDDGALVVCGPSGRGKSTLAAVLGSLGLAVLAEDGVALTIERERVVLWPGPIGVRLHSRTASVLGSPALVAAAVRGKGVYAPAGSPDRAEPVPVAGLLVLEPRGGSALSVRPLSSPEAVANLLANVHGAGVESLPRTVSRTADLVRRVACYRARFPDDLVGVPELAAQLLARIDVPLARAA